MSGAVHRGPRHSFEGPLDLDRDRPAGRLDAIGPSITSTRPDQATITGSPRSIGGFGVSVAAVRQAIELAARKYCSVGAMLAAGETVIHHRYRVIGTGAVPFDETGEVRVSGPFARPEAL